MRTAPPEIEKHEQRPTVELRRFVDRFWGWQCAGSSVKLPLLLPGLGAELFVHYGTPFSVEASSSSARPASGAPTDLGRAPLVCVRSRPLALVESRGIGFISARLRAGALARFTRVPMRELLDANMSAEDVWGAAGKELVQKIGEAPGFTERASILEQFLMARLPDAKPDAVAERAILLLYGAHASASIADVAASCGLGRRQFERRIQAASGLSPVELRRLARFYHTARRMLLQPEVPASDSALLAGYYDQPHFIREFSRFAGSTPEAFRQIAAARTHFYNPPRSLVPTFVAHPRARNPNHAPSTRQPLRSA